MLLRILFLFYKYEKSCQCSCLERNTNRINFGFFFFFLHFSFCPRVISQQISVSSFQNLVSVCFTGFLKQVYRFPCIISSLLKFISFSAKRSWNKSHSWLLYSLSLYVCQDSGPKRQAILSSHSLQQVVSSHQAKPVSTSEHLRLPFLMNVLTIEILLNFDLYLNVIFPQMLSWLIHRATPKEFSILYSSFVCFGILASISAIYYLHFYFIFSFTAMNQKPPIIGASMRLSHTWSMLPHPVRLFIFHNHLSCEFIFHVSSHILHCVLFAMIA